LQPDKVQLLKSILLQLEETLAVLATSAAQARDAATNEESKAENKYDTRGLEASYLAGAQSQRIAELKRNIQTIKNLTIAAAPNSITLNCLIEVRIDEEEKTKWLFLLPVAGGLNLDFQNQVIQTITPESPVGKNLLGRKSGDNFSLNIGKTLKEYLIEQIC
jgi:transcription elongation GreA/GreB family factor